jgi:hypothetical protein
LTSAITGPACFDFLNPPEGFKASTAGFVIYLSICPGTIWLWMVFDSSSYSSYGMYLGFPGRLYGCFSNFRRRS